MAKKTEKKAAKTKTSPEEVGIESELWISSLGGQYFDPDSAAETLGDGEYIGRYKLVSLHRVAKRNELVLVK